MKPGSYLAGKKSGIGKYYYLDGTVYDGSYWNGFQEGNGELKYTSGTNFFVLFCILYDNIDCSLTGHVYNGQFVKSVIEGQGTLRYSDGRIYKGHFKNGMLHGEGVLKSSDDGIIFSGSWRDRHVQIGSPPVPTELIENPLPVTSTSESATPISNEKTEICDKYICN